MKTITINVSPEIASSYERADEKDRSRVELYINAWLKEIFIHNQVSADQRLYEIMKKSSAEAKKNGFKPEMLEDILKDDDK